VLLIPAVSISHPGLLAALLLVAFALGVCGYIMRSRPLVLASIVVIGLVSLYFVAAGEVTSINK
jgi:hypothetical protein